MNGIEYYNRQKEDWSDNEIQQLKTEYEINEMTISQIADIHYRTPGSISYKLKKLGLISNNILSRGYYEYKNSDLYKKIVEANKGNDNFHNIKKKIKLPFSEIYEMRNEILDLKKDVKEILHLMNAVYDFEKQ